MNWHCKRLHHLYFIAHDIQILAMNYLTLFLLLLMGMMSNSTSGQPTTSQNVPTSDGLRTPSGLYYKELQSGNGVRPKLTDKVNIRFYEDESLDTVVQMMFPGLQEGLQMMSVGSKYRFKIPPQLAFGDKGSGSIYPNSTIICEVELLHIQGNNTIPKVVKENKYQTPKITSQGVGEMNKAMELKENSDQMAELDKARNKLYDAIPSFTKSLELKSEFDKAMEETVKFQSEITKAGTPPAEQKLIKKLYEVHRLASENLRNAKNQGINFNEDEEAAIKKYGEFYASVMANLKKAME